VKNLERKCICLSTILYLNSQAKLTLDELEKLSHRLISSREEFESNERALATSNHDLEASRKNLQDVIAMNEIESKNLQVSKNRCVELRKELASMEEALFSVKESIAEKENKIRITKSIAADQLRILSNDLNKISSDFQVKKRNMGELEKVSSMMEEEIAIRRRDLESNLLTLTRETEQENGKLASMRNDIRVCKVEIESLKSNKRQLEHDLTRLQDMAMSEKRQREQYEIEMKRRADVLERSVGESERKARVVKESVLTLENEHKMLQHSVEELRRQKNDLERSAEMRRRTSEEEVNQTQQQVSACCKFCYDMQSALC
jgi:chromosome segregation ATPase